MKKTEEKIDSQRLVTEEYLDGRLEKHQQATQEYLDQRLGEFRGEMREEMRTQTVEILQGVDKILVRFDAAEKDHAAHGMLHGRITDDLHGHDLRIKKLEARAA